MTWNGIPIRTSFEYPPVPFRSMDWAAWLNGHEERGAEYGPTRDIAVAELIQCLWERGA